MANHERDTMLEDQLQKTFACLSASGDTNRGLQLLNKLNSSASCSDTKRIRDAWTLENIDAIDAYNEYVSTHGSYSDSIRKF